MKVYADTTYLVAMYFPDDTFTGLALRSFEQIHGPPLLYTPIHRLETRNTIRQLVFHQKTTKSQARQILRDIESDLDDGDLVHASLDWTETLRECERLSDAHTPGTGCRAMDILHVASATVLSVDLFLTFDGRQFDLAKASGLIAENPAIRG